MQKLTKERMMAEVKVVEEAKNFDRLLLAVQTHNNTDVPENKIKNRSSLGLGKINDDKKRIYKV